MRLLALLITAFLTAGSAFGGQSSSAASAPASSPEPVTPGSQKGAPAAVQDAPSAGLPVSLDKIRGALEQTPVEPIRGLNIQAAHFKVAIQERQKIEELLATLDFKTGPSFPGGWAAYEMQRIARPPQENPLVQPYAAFSTSELLTIAVENLTIKYLGGRLIDAVTSAERARAERAARDEVARAMAEFCAAQPMRGAGLQGCALSPALR